MDRHQPTASTALRIASHSKNDKNEKTDQTNQEYIHLRSEW